MLTINAIPAKFLFFPAKKQIRISGLNFVQVSKCYPEAYNVYDNNGDQVGQVSLRWGCLSCKYPNSKGERIYESFFERDFMGEFDTDDQRRIFLEDVAHTLIQKISGIKCTNRNQFECIKWFQKYGFTFAEKGDVCNLIGKLEDENAWVIKSENGAVQIVPDEMFKEHFKAKVVANESMVIICA